VILEILAGLALAGAPRHLDAGAPVGMVSIPRLHVRLEIHEGVTAAVLALGPGHYPQTSLPGLPGTTAIAGHRVTHTRPFLELNRLRKGDAISIRTSWGTFTYRVYAERIVAPTARWVLRKRSFQQLVLTACHPPRTADRRYVVFARRVGKRLQRRVALQAAPTLVTGVGVTPFPLTPAQCPEFGGVTFLGSGCHRFAVE
jgi:sortase A